MRKILIHIFCKFKVSKEILKYLAEGKKIFCGTFFTLFYAAALFHPVKLSQLEIFIINDAWQISTNINHFSLSLQNMLAAPTHKVFQYKFSLSKKNQKNSEKQFLKSKSASFTFACLPEVPEKKKLCHSFSPFSAGKSR